MRFWGVILGVQLDVPGDAVTVWLGNVRALREDDKPSLPGAWSPLLIPDDVAATIIPEARVCFGNRSAYYHFGANCKLCGEQSVSGMLTTFLHKPGKFPCPQCVLAPLGVR